MKSLDRPKPSTKYTAAVPGHWSGVPCLSRRITFGGNSRHRQMAHPSTPGFVVEVLQHLVSRCSRSGLRDKAGTGGEVYIPHVAAIKDQRQVPHG